MADIADTKNQARSRLLARMAGNIAAGICSHVKPPYTVSDRAVISSASVDIAKDILRLLEVKP